MTPDELFHCGEWLDRFRRTPGGDALLRGGAPARSGRLARQRSSWASSPLKQARFEDALALFDMAAKRDADNPRIDFGRALVALGLGRPDEAYESFRRASISGDEAAAARLGLARLELRRGRNEAALDWMRQAETLNGGFADVPALAAVAHRRLAQPEKALAAAERALALDPMHFMAARETTLALRALGRPTA